MGPAIGMSGVAWLAGQSESRQVAVLGKAKCRFYAASQIQLAQLVEVTEPPVYGMSWHERSLKALGLDYRVATPQASP